MAKLTAMVTYYTRYRSIDKLHILLSFGLGKEVAVNAIIGQPTLKEWKCCVDFARDIFTSEELQLLFDMSYKIADLGLPKDVIFGSTSVVCPKQQCTAGLHIVSIDRYDNSVETIPST